MDFFKPYYPVFKFVLIFGVLYFTLSLLYYGFLQIDFTAPHYPDPVTAMVSDQTQGILKVFGYQAQIYDAPTNPSVLLYIDNQIIYRVIEGCNAVSVMLLFAAFVIAFAKAWKTTILYMLIGFIIIYLVNLARLVLLAIVYKDFPQFQEFSHDIIFPAIIYGTVILLWVLWIRSSKTST